MFFMVFKLFLTKTHNKVYKLGILTIDMLRKKGIVKCYNVKVDPELWVKFKICLNKVYSEEFAKREMDINDVLIILIKKFVEENGK